MEDWSLQAVVGGGGYNNTNQYSSFFGPMEFHEGGDDVNDHTTTTTSFLLSCPCCNELEQLYKPFYSIFPTNQIINIPNQPEEIKVDDLQTNDTTFAADLVPSTTTSTARSPKYKRRSVFHINCTYVRRSIN